MDFLLLPDKHVTKPLPSSIHSMLQSGYHSKPHVLAHYQFTLETKSLTRPIGRALQIPVVSYFDHYVQQIILYVFPQTLCTKVLLSITSHTIMYQDHGHCETFSSKLFIHNHSFTQKDQNDLTQSFGKLHPSFALWQLTLMTPLFGAHSRPRCPVLSVKT